MLTHSPSGPQLSHGQLALSEEPLDHEPPLHNIHASGGIDLVQETLSFDVDLFRHRGKLPHLRRPRIRG